MACGGADESPGPQIIIPAIANVIAGALTSEKIESLSRSARHATPAGAYSVGLVRSCIKTLKRHFNQFHIDGDWILGHPSNSTTLLAPLQDIASKFKNILEGDYIRSFFHNKTPPSSRYELLHALYLVLKERPSEFEEIRVIRNDVVEQLLQLLPAMEEFCELVEDAMPTTSDVSRSTVATADSHPWSSNDSLRALESVQSLTERLHRSLHQDWPCRRHGDEHAGALGECTHAYMQLDPQWVEHGVEGNVFFIVLSDHENYQECNVRIEDTM
jgi:hypothetical protein